MPSKTCLKCGHENKEFTGAPDAACPACGAIYAKVERAQRQAESAPAATPETPKPAPIAAPPAKLRGSLCAACGSTRIKRQVKGSFGIELALWLIGFLTLIFGIGFIILIIALIYSLWRMFSARVKVCAGCGSTSIIQADSPMGRRLVEELGLGPQDMQTDIPMPRVSAIVLGLAAVGIILAVATNSFTEVKGLNTPNPSNPPERQQTSKQVAMGGLKLEDFSWGTTAFDTVMEATFVIRNDSPHDVKDIVMRCRSFGESGTQLGTHTGTIYEIVQKGETRTFKDFNMGFINRQAVRARCNIHDLDVVG